MATVAGHTFPLSDFCSCGIHWLRIQDCDASCIGQPGWAHTGNLTGNEQAEIVAEKLRRNQKFADAMGYVSRSV